MPTTTFETMLLRKEMIAALVRLERRADELASQIQFLKNEITVAVEIAKNSN